MPIDTETRMPTAPALAAQWAGNLLAPVAFLFSSRSPTSPCREHATPE